MSDGVDHSRAAAGTVPTDAEITIIAGELGVVRDAVAAMPVPPAQADLDKVQPRLAAIAAAVASWKPAPIITSPEPKPELPEPGRIVRAAVGTFRDLLAQHREPNDRIVLAPGIYPGDIALPFDVPLQIVAEEPLTAVLSGNVAVNGSDIVLSGVDLPHAGKRGGASVALAGKRNRLHRSRVLRGSGNCVEMPGEDCVVEWCDLSVWGKQEVPNLQFGSFGLVHDPGAKGRRNRVYRCRLHDGPFKDKADYHRFAVTGIGVGVNPRDFAIESHLEVIENLIEDAGDLDLSIKTSHNIIRGNTILGANAKSIGNNRSGNYNRWESNWFGKLAYGQSIVVHGGHHLIVGNHVEDPIVLKWGNFRWNQMPSGDTRQHAAHRVKLVGNVGPKVILGHRYASEARTLTIPPSECIFDLNQPYEDRGGIGETREDMSGIGFAPARKLTRGEVGPFGGPESS